MKLTELDNSRSQNALRALNEQYEVPFNVDKLNMVSTHSMLSKVRGLIAESKQSTDFYQKQTTPAYMKLVFMEQALSAHYSELRSRPARIVVENEEVEKSQVVLAAQDLVDSIQKMLEQVGQMQVKELPALVSSIESEIGVEESQQYNDQVTQQLDQLSAALKEAFTGLKGALGTVTGQGGGEFEAGAELGAEAGMDAGLDAGMDAGMDLGAEEEFEELPPEEEEEVPPSGGVGRAKR